MEPNPYPQERALLEELRSAYRSLNDTDKYSVRYHLFFEQVKLIGDKHEPRIEKSRAQGAR
jgi:hypothetical protein